MGQSVREGKNDDAVPLELGEVLPHFSAEQTVPSYASCGSYVVRLRVYAHRAPSEQEVVQTSLPEPGCSHPIIAHSSTAAMCWRRLIDRWQQWYFVASSLGFQYFSHGASAVSIAQRLQSAIRSTLNAAMLPQQQESSSMHRLHPVASLPLDDSAAKGWVDSDAIDERKTRIRTIAHGTVINALGDGCVSCACCCQPCCRIHR